MTWSTRCTSPSSTRSPTTSASTTSGCTSSATARTPSVRSTSVTTIPPELRDLIESGPLPHLPTINAEGSPQVSLVWIGLDGDAILSGPMSRYLKPPNIARDPRVVLSFTAPRDPSGVLNEYAVLRAHATVEPSDDTWDLLDRLTKVYMSPDDEFPAPK